MKIAIFRSKSFFTPAQQQKLAALGEVVYTDTDNEYPVDTLVALAKNAEVLAPDPGNFGGFEKAQGPLTQVAQTLPNLKGIALSTTSYGWIDQDYFKKRGVPVCNIPGYSRESVAEHALAMLLGLAKRIFVTDRKTQKGAYQLQMGFELKGKTLGIIGLGSIGSRMAELGQGIGMKVIAHNRSPKKQKGVEMKSLDEVLRESDALSFHTIDSNETRGMINKNTLAKMKTGVVIVNTVNRDLVDEEAMAEALRSDKVFGYALEAEDLTSGPLVNIENAVLIKGFGWYTKEALANLREIWIQNITAIIRGTPEHRVI